MFLKTIRLNKLLPGVLLLTLLFFYDIFWVFYSTKFTKGGESVMVAVATGFEAPIKLLMPHLTSFNYPTTTCSMLGLGDIVIPGMYIGFLIRFGRYTAFLNTEKQPSSSPRNPYVCPAIAAYSLALFSCGAFLVIFNHAQPALLYIVPALLGATVIFGGCIHGDL